MNNFNGFWLTLLVLPFALCGCTLWHRVVVSPPPRYKLYQAPSLDYRLHTTNWMNAGDLVSNNITLWRQDYSNALAGVFPWVPDPDTLFSTFTNELLEYGQSDPDYTNIVWKTAHEFLFNDFFKAAYYCPSNCCCPSSKICEAQAATNQLNYYVGFMFRLADMENRDLFQGSADSLKRRPSRGSLPGMTSPDLPVGVSLSSDWQEHPASTSQSSPANSATTNSTSAVLDKLLVTFQAASSTPTPKTNAPADSATDTIPDFTEDQKVTVNVSTILNSASTMDRIDWVSTYVYLYPWPLSLNGSTVLEREFWRQFFSRNIGRDILVRTNSEVLQSDLNDAIRNIRVRVHDLSTLSDLADVNLGTLQQTFNNGFSAGLSAVAKGSPFTTISPDLNFTQNMSSVSSNSPKQQIDERSTYIDSLGDFFRINQRGVQSLDVAGRFKETVTLHIPASSQQFYVVLPPKAPPKNPDTNLPPPANAPAQASAVAQTNASTQANAPAQAKAAPQTNDDCELETASQPLYSEVNAITFSVIVARQTTRLAADTEDRYGLNDRNGADLIVGVTCPEPLKLWKWERGFMRLTTWDIFGKSDRPAKLLYMNTFRDETPAPLCLANFRDPEFFKFVETLQQQCRTNRDTPIQLKYGGGNIFIGCVANMDDPRALGPITP